MRFSYKQNLPETKWKSADSLDIAFNTHVRLKFIADVISLWSFWQKWNLISGDKISCKQYPKMPTHVHQNIKSFWNAAEMKRHVSRICFYVSLKISRPFEFISTLMWTHFEESEIAV